MIKFFNNAYINAPVSLQMIWFYLLIITILFLTLLFYLHAGFKLKILKIIVGWITCFDTSVKILVSEFKSVILDFNPSCWDTMVNYGDTIHKYLSEIHHFYSFVYVLPIFVIIGILLILYNEKKQDIMVFNRIVLIVLCICCIYILTQYGVLLYEYTFYPELYIKPLESSIQVYARTGIKLIVFTGLLNSFVFLFLFGFFLCYTKVFHGQKKTCVDLKKKINRLQKITIQKEEKKKEIMLSYLCFLSLMLFVLFLHFGGFIIFLKSLHH